MAGCTKPWPRSELKARSQPPFSCLFHVQPLDCPILALCRSSQHVLLLCALSVFCIVLSARAAWAFCMHCLLLVLALGPAPLAQANILRLVCITA